jgi:hypothetical protein
LEQIIHNEKQEKYFGKRGISWHITCIVYLKNNELISTTYVHIFDSCSQDVNAVIGCIDNVFFQIFSKFGSKIIFFRSDNAGCYHCKSLIPIVYFLAKKHHLIAKQYDFCDSQTGKDICDRKISPIKKAIYQFANSQNDVKNESEMKRAIDANPNLTGVQSVVCDLEKTCFKEDFKFKIAISLIYSFSYENDSLTAF